MNVGDIARPLGLTLNDEVSVKPVSGIVRDNREVMPGVVFAAIKGTRTDGHNFICASLDAGAPCCIAESLPEGETRPVLIVPDVMDALVTIARSCRDRLDIPIVGVTGSSGKTTTKEMIASVLGQRLKVLKTENNYNNRLGVPLTMFRIGEEHEAAVVEIGISHFGEMRELGSVVKPQIAVFTNIGMSHTEALGDRDGVMSEKTELIKEMPDVGTVIINGDDDKLAKLRCEQKIVSYGINGGSDVRAENIVLKGTEGAEFDIVSENRKFSAGTNAYGKHLIYAALAAASVGIELGLSDEEISTGIAEYAPLGSRARLVETGIIRVIDDSYNANPDSLMMAIASAADMPGRLVCILGDMFELGERATELHSECGAAAKRAGAELLTVGDMSKSMGGTHFESIEKLLETLPKIIKPGDNVLVKASHAMGFGEIAEFLLRFDASAF